MPNSLSIGIIGSGTAGAASALFLNRAGHDVTVYEAVQSPGPVGAGITLQPSGMAVLDELGLLGPILARGSVLSGLDGTSAAGKRVMELEYRDLHPKAFGLGIHRGLLFNTLWGALGPSGIAVETGCNVTELAGDEAARYVIEASGKAHGPHDLIVVADGVKSDFRHQSALRRKSTLYPFGALWFLARDPGRIFPQRITQFLRGSSEMLGFLPTGLGPAGETPLVSLYWSFEVSREAQWRADGLDAWKQQVLQLSPLARPILDQISSIDSVLLARYRDVVMYPWHDRGIVFIGDAAHATSPQLGQGANLALADARVLADCIQSSQTLDSALAQYSARRRDSLRYYQFATRWLTPWFQSNLSALGILRDLFMNPASRVPYIRRRMLNTMCGLERGFLARPDEMPRAILQLPDSSPGGGTEAGAKVG